MTRLSAVIRATTWLLRLAWATSPALTVGFFAFALVRSAVPAGLALVARGLINAAVHVTGHADREMGGLVPWLVAGLGLGAIEALVPFVINYFRPRLADELAIAATSMILGHADTLDVATLEDARQREVVDWIQHDGDVSLSRAIAEVELLVSGTLQTIVLSAILIHLEPLVLAVVVPLALPYLYFLWRLARRLHRRAIARQRRRTWTRYFASLLTGTRALAEVRLLGIAPHLLDQCRALMLRLRDENRAMLRQAFVQGSSFTLLTMVGLYAIFALVATRVVHGTLTVGDLAVFAAASPRLRSALERTLLSLRNLVQEGLMLDRASAFLRLAPRLVSGAAVAPSPGTGELLIEDVWFTYPSATAPVLCGVSLTVRRGEIVGLVGPNGAGKTTLVKLIARLYDPDRGRVLLDGLDLREWPLPELHRRMALVAQDATRFEATAAENIAYGDWPRAAGDPENLRTATAAGGADELIRSLPSGYDTLLGRLLGGQDLSGGQWQRIALARAFVRDAPVLILDEPTAHLDAALVDDLQHRLRELARGRTTLLISHRPETLALADRVVTLQHGRIVDSQLDRSASPGAA